MALVHLTVRPSGAASLAALRVVSSAAPQHQTWKAARVSACPRQLRCFLAALLKPRVGNRRYCDGEASGIRRVILAAEITRTELETGPRMSVTSEGTNSMGQRPSCEANQFPSSQEIPRIL